MHRSIRWLSQPRAELRVALPCCHSGNPLPPSLLDASAAAGAGAPASATALPREPHRVSGALARTPCGPPDASASDRAAEAEAAQGVAPLAGGAASPAPCPPPGTPTRFRVGSAGLGAGMKGGAGSAAAVAALANWATSGATQRDRISRPGACGCRPSFMSACARAGLRALGKQRRHSAAASKLGAC